MTSMLPVTLTAVSAAYLFASLLLLAPKKPGYSHVRHTISEIGEIGSPNQRFVAFGVFLPIGLLILLAAYLIRPLSPVSAALALCISVGYVGAAIFPCDPGSPASGSPRQGVHNLCGGIEYIGGGFAFFTLAESFGQPFKAAGFLVIASAIALTFLPSTSVRGMIQRIAESCLFAGLAAANWQASALVSGA